MSDANRRDAQASAATQAPEAACEVAGSTLAAVGSGLRRVFTVNIYRATLYAVRPPERAADVFEATQPLRIRYDYLHGPISRERMATAWEAALHARLPPAEASAGQDFLATVTDYHRGDVTVYDLLPDGTTQVTHNGQLLAVIASHALRHAILDVMLGADAIDPRLRTALVPALAGAAQAA